MSFQEFTNNLFNCFISVFNNITSLFSIMIQNNYIKFITYVILLYLGIEFLFKIIDIILNIFSQKKSASKEKKTNTSTDIE